MKKLISLLLFPTIFYSQSVLKNEQLLFSFRTKSGKTVLLVTDKDERYIQYRFGNGRKTELEFPKNRDEESWKKFSYSGYFRGGGKANSAMQLDGLSFVNNGVKYLIFSEYHSEDESNEVGIKILDKDGKIKNIPGIYKTVKGCICRLNDTEKIEKKEGDLEF